MEIIDLYTKDKQKLKKTFTRHQDTLLPDEYYLLEQAWIVNNNNEILLTKRSLEKSFGGMWEATAGHVKAGETDLDGIMREVEEEIGIKLEKDDIIFLKSLIVKQSILDVSLVKKDIDIKDIKLRENETIDVKYVSFDKFKKMLKNNEIIQNLSYFIEIYEKYIIND